MMKKIMIAFYVKLIVVINKLGTENRSETLKNVFKLDMKIDADSDEQHNNSRSEQYHIHTLKYFDFS